MVMKIGHISRGAEGSIPAGQFKARCLGLIDEVARLRREIVISKHGKAVAKLVPLEQPAAASVFGCMRGSVLEADDIVSPTGETWDADR
jgi:prevent-host-death family protein